MGIRSTLINTEFAEDSAHTSGDKGQFVLAVRQDTAASTAGTTGDYTALTCDSSGRLHATLSNCEKAEDAAHASGDRGIMALAVRKDTPAALAGTDGDYAPLEVDVKGRLHTNPLGRLTHTYTSSADMSTAAAITAAPTSGQKIVVHSVIIGGGSAAGEYRIEEETSATVYASVFLDVNHSIQLTFPGGIKLATADKKLFGKSPAGTVRFTVQYESEA